MGNFDLTPLFRTTVGFDRLTRLMESALLSRTPGPSYPPYNIEKTGEDAYRITVAVAGFGKSDLDAVVQENRLVISGKSKDGNADYLYRGIAGRAFRHVFALADTVKVTGARLVNGLLHIDLAREIPEEAGPRRIEIKTAPKVKSIAKEAA